MAIEIQALEDGRQEKRLGSYTKFWQKDASKEADVDTSNRLDSYGDVVNGMSNLTIDLFPPPLAQAY
jgi:sterol 24-C-methyltransferase